MENIWIKAYEIVVENTHHIADMCETISICQKDKYYPSIINAGVKLKEKCYALLNEKYHANHKRAVDRLDWELAAFEKTGMESYILQISELLNKANLRAEDISLRGTAGGSIVAYLLGITNIDPLAYGIEPETIFGINGQREIDIDINIPSNMHMDVISKLTEIEGIGKYIWAGKIQVISDSLAQAMIEKYMEDEQRYFEEEIVNKLRWSISGNYLGRGKYPGGIIVFPEGCKYEEMIPTTKVDGNFEISYFDYFSVDKAFMKFDLLQYDIAEMLIKLEMIAGVDLCKIPVESAEVLALFEVDSEGNVPGCEGLPEFKSEYVRKIISVLKPKSFADIVKISSISHGACVWKNNGEILVANKEVGIKEIIADRDDVFAYNLSLGLDRHTAFEISEAVRKGIVSRGINAKWLKWKKELIEAGAPKWYIWSCEQIRYLCPRASRISYVHMIMKLGWFKVHYPELYNNVLKEYEDLV